MLKPIWIFVVFTASILFANSHLSGQEIVNEVRGKVDAYIDLRFDADEDATERLVADLAESGVTTLAELEECLRSIRAEYPDTSDLNGEYTWHDIDCFHVDYSTRFLM